MSFVCATAVERDGWVRALGRVWARGYALVVLLCLNFFLIVRRCPPARNNAEPFLGLLACVLQRRPTVWLDS